MREMQERLVRILFVRALKTMGTSGRLILVLVPAQGVGWPDVTKT